MERPPEPRIRTFRGGGSPEPGMRSPGGQRRCANRSLTANAKKVSECQESGPPGAMQIEPLSSRKKYREPERSPGPLALEILLTEAAQTAWGCFSSSLPNTAFRISPPRACPELAPFLSPHLGSTKWLTCLAPGVPSYSLSHSFQKYIKKQFHI